MKFEYTWRWYGPDDPVSLADIKQTDATGIVNALHHIPVGEVWEVEEIQKRKDEIESFGLTWSVVESVPVSEDIKKQTGNCIQHIDNYKQTIRNLGVCGIKTICYNFMPILDWTRTDLEFELNNGVQALRFDITAFAAFELFILKRKEAEQAYDSEQIAKAKLYFENLRESEKEVLTKNIIAGLPGGHEGYTIEEFKQILSEYDGITTQNLEANLSLFLQAVIPTAENSEVKMCIHPDDPPYPILGLPRVVSTDKDIERLLNNIESPSNGITLCTGSYGVRLDNNMVQIAERFADKVHFLHFRSVQVQEDGSFYEAGHLKGSSYIAKVMNAMIHSDKLSEDHIIPMRPDHGHKMLDDIKKHTNPGYSCIGRMKGLSELRGLEQGLRFTIK